MGKGDKISEYFIDKILKKKKIKIFKLIFTEVFSFCSFVSTVKKVNNKYLFCRQWSCLCCKDCVIGMGYAGEIGPYGVSLSILLFFLLLRSTNIIATAVITTIAPITLAIIIPISKGSQSKFWVTE